MIGDRISWDQPDTRATIVAYHFTILDENSIVLYNNSTNNTSFLLLDSGVLTKVSCGRYTVRIVVEFDDGQNRHMGPASDLHVAPVHSSG